MECWSVSARAMKQMSAGSGGLGDDGVECKGEFRQVERWSVGEGVQGR